MFAGIRRIREIYVCYNVPLGFANGILFFNAGSEFGLIEVNGSTVFSTMGESTIGEVSKTPCALTSSMMDKEGFNEAGVIIGLVADVDLFAPVVLDFFILL
jgi:hypothetical protein